MAAKSRLRASAGRTSEDRDDESTPPPPPAPVLPVSLKSVPPPPSAGAPPPPAPPPMAAGVVLTKTGRVRQLPAPASDPRADLLSAIRNAGGFAGLRKTRK